MLVKEAKDSLNTLIKKINLKTINQLKVPSNKYQFDGAMYTTIEVILNGETYSSIGFDDDNPPKKLNSFINFLRSLVQ